MKRFLLWFFGIIIPLQFTLFFCLGKYLFFKETIVSFPEAQKVEIKTYSNANPDLIITIDRNTRYRIGINEEQEQCYRKNGHFIGYWYKMHLWWFTIYWIALIGVFAYDFIVLVQTCGCLWNSSTQKFSPYTSHCNYCAKRCEFYNKLNNYDSTPIKNEFWRFWGY